MTPDHSMLQTDALASLNPEQRRAAAHGIGNGHGPLVIIAAAGSGKTETLAHRVAQLIKHGAHPGRILLLTFSRRAAQEMERRGAPSLNKRVAPCTYAGIGKRSEVPSHTEPARPPTLF